LALQASFLAKLLVQEPAFYHTVGKVELVNTSACIALADIILFFLKKEPKTLALRGYECGMFILVGI
jgi:hypothetical protein